MFDPEIGGIETVVKQQAEVLSQHFHVTVLCSTKKRVYQTKHEKIGGYHVTRVSSLGAFLGLPISAFFVFYLISYIKKNDLTIFHLPNPLVDIVSVIIRLIKRNYVVYWHGDITRQSKLSKFLMPLTFTLLRSARIWTTSEPLRTQSNVLKHFANVMVLPIGLADPINRPQKKIHLPNKFFLSFGRLSNYKGMDVLIEAYAQSNASNHMDLVICGEGPSSSLIKQKIEQYALHQKVKFINREASEAEKNFLFSRCTAFLFPSTAASEAFGITQLEALSFSKPVLNTNLPTGVPWVSIDQITGLTAKPNDVIDFAKKIDMLLDKDLNRLGKNARSRFEKNFDLNTINNRLLNEVRNIIDQ